MLLIFRNQNMQHLPHDQNHVFSGRSYLKCSSIMQPNATVLLFAPYKIALKSG